MRKMISKYYSVPVIIAALGLIASCSKKGGSVTPVKTQVLTVTTIAGNGTASFADGTGASAEVNTASDVAVSSNGTLFVADWLNNRVRTINLSTDAVTTFAGSGLQGFGNGTAASATFNGAAHIAFDKSGNLFVTDEQNNAIREVTTAGNVITIAGNGVQGYVDGPAASAEFNVPGDLILDGNGDLYVADTHNEVIRKITMATKTVSTYAGSGVQALVDGDLSAAAFNSPYGLAFDASGNLFVADAANNVVRKITISTGKVSTFAGTGVQGLTNGAAASATFYHPGALAFDASGDLFVSELANNTIRKIAADGTVTTYAGTGAEGAADGPATTATFKQPNGIAFDNSGNLYVADELNSRIRKIALK